MLDAYIIEDIRNREERGSDRAPLHIEVPFDAEEEKEPTTDDKIEDPRGVVIIDFETTSSSAQISSVLDR